MEKAEEWLATGECPLTNPVQHLLMTSQSTMDDLCVTAQYSSFTEVENTIGDALNELTQNYRSNSLRANPDKTQVIAFNLRNKEANRSL